MVSILVRGLDESVKRQFAEQAERHGRSMEAEARDILTKGVTRTNNRLGPHTGRAGGRGSG